MQVIILNCCVNHFERHFLTRTMDLFQNLCKSCNLGTQRISQLFFKGRIIIWCNKRSLFSKNEFFPFNSLNSMFKLSSIPQSDLCFRILKVEVCDEVSLSIDSKTLLHQGSQA